MKFRLVLQKTPFAYTNPSFDTVEACDRVGAYLAAYNRYASNGLNTSSALRPIEKGVNSYGALFDVAEIERLKAAGVPDEGYPCELYVMKIDEIREVKEPDTQAENNPFIVEMRSLADKLHNEVHSLDMDGGTVRELVLCMVEQLDDDEAPLQRMTIIDDAEVFNSDGSLALMANGWDMLYLNVCPAPNPEDHPGEVRPSMTDEQHQAIIDVIVKALGTDKPKVRAEGAPTVKPE